MSVLHRGSGSGATARSSFGPSNGELGSTLADRFYAARDEGERLNQVATAFLNSHPPHGGVTGGEYPDGRRHATWSWRRILEAVAWEEFGVPVEEATEESANFAGASLPPLPGRKVRRAWIIIEPYKRSVGARPILERRKMESGEWEVWEQTYFQMACVLSHLAENQDILDPAARPGYFVGATDTHSVTRQHQFAIALLGYPMRKDYCHPSWGCQCNMLRYEYNVPPIEHSKPTDWLKREEVDRAMWSDLPTSTPNVIPFRDYLTPPTSVWSTNPSLGPDDNTPPDPRRERRNTGA